MTEKEFREKERHSGIKKAAAKSKKRKKKRALITLSVTLLMLLSLLVVIIGVSVFKVENITVLGNSIYTAEQVIEASEIQIGDSIFLISEKTESEKLQKILPFIDKVTLKKTFPSTLTIEVLETEEAMCFYSDGVYYTASETGKILSQSLTQPDELAVIVTGDGCTFTMGEKYACNNEQKSALLERLLTFAKQDETQITLINVSDIYRSYFVIDNRIAVELGSASYLEQKLEFLPKMLQSMSGTEHNVADLGGWTPDNDEAISYQKKLDAYFQYK